MQSVFQQGEKETLITGVFDFYQNMVKPLYSHIEARSNEVPFEVSNEIHAAFDHQKRILTPRIRLVTQ